MSDPVRWLEDPDTAPELAGLLASAREPVLDAAASQRVLEGTRAKSAGIGPSTVALRVVAGLAGAAVVVAIVLGLWPDAQGSNPTRAAMPVAPAPVAEPTPAVETAPGPTPEPPAVVDPDASAPTVEPASPPTDDAAPAPTRAKPKIDEAELLLAARKALPQDPARTLALTRQHERRFRRGRFAEERELLAVRALVALGRDQQARERADAFARRYPTSSHRAAVEAAAKGR